VFSHLTSRLRLEVESVREILVISDGLRELLLTQRSHLSSFERNEPPEADKNANVAYCLSRLLPNAPDKLDWQIYDHCASLTRLYAAYDRFVRDLVSEYVTLLPNIYQKYADLPISVTTQHRSGIGRILVKLGDKGRYKRLEEQNIIRELATSLEGTPGYTLLAEAFFVDTQNLRFDMLIRLFSSLGFEHPGRFINKNSAVAEFIKAERADSSTPEKELNDFVKYRNEAAHRKVDNVLSIDAIASIGRFIVALGDGLVDLVDEGVLRRHMDLGHCSLVLTVKEVYHDGYVVVGTLNPGTLKVGDGLIVSERAVCRRALVESIELNDTPAEQLSGDGATEVGLKLNRRAKVGSQLCRLQMPGGEPSDVQLQLEDATPTAVEAADTDLSDSDPGERVGEETAEIEEPDPLP